MKLQSLKRHVRMRLSGPDWKRHPEVIQLDTHNYCNLHCVYCNVQGSFSLPHGRMDNETSKEVIDYWRNCDIRWIAPFMNGDPLLEPRLHEICDYTAKYNFPCVVDTNGVSFKHRERLRHPNLKLVRFTISASTPEIYKTVHGKDCFDDALKTFKWLNKNRYPTQQTWLHFIQCKENIHETRRWLEMFEGYGRTVFPIHKGIHQNNSLHSYSEFEVKIPHHILPNGAKRTSHERMQKHYPCPCWGIMGISWQGDILQCVDFPYKYNYGKVGDDDLAEAWHERNRNRMDNPCCNSCSLRFPSYKKILDKWVD